MINIDSNIKGTIGEAAAIVYFVNLGYQVFTAFGTASKVDLVVYKDNILQRVSVKSTSQKKVNRWLVRIKQTTRKGEMPFDRDSVDLVAAYSIPEDRIVVVDAKTITGKFELRIKSMDS